MNWLIDMFGVREPYKGEDSYFKKNPKVGGMMTEDNMIILNPYSSLTPEQKNAVALNEAIRLVIKKSNFPIDFELTDSQKEFFKGTEYEKNQEEAKKSILARILTNDSSVQTPSEEQLSIANSLKSYINSLNPQNNQR